MRTESPARLEGDLNIVLRGLRLRGMNGPNGLLRMGGWARQKYGRTVGNYVRAALNQLGDRTLARVQDAPKRLRVTVVHKGVFDDDNLRSTVKPLLDFLKARPIRVERRVLGMEPGIIADDDPAHLSHEVVQARGAPEVRVEAWGEGMGEAFGGRTVTI